MFPFLVGKAKLPPGQWEAAGTSPGFRASDSVDSETVFLLGIHSSENFGGSGKRKDISFCQKLEGGRSLGKLMAQMFFWGGNLA